MRPVLVRDRTSTGRTSDQYWLVFAPAKRLSDCTFFEDEVEGIESCGGRWLGGLLGRGTLLIIVEAYE